MARCAGCGNITSTASVSSKVTGRAAIAAVVALAGIRIAEQGVGTAIEGSILQMLTAAFRASAAGLAITADALGGIACAGIQDLAVTQHSRLGGGAVQASQRRGRVQENKGRRRGAVLSF